MSAAPRRALLALAAVLLAAPPPARALLDDRLELFAVQSVTRDDNVFRLSGSADPVAVLGTASKADTYTTTSLGLALDLPVSLQRLQARFAWIGTHYQRFSVLDLDYGYDARAAWLWQAGADLSGKLAYTDTLALASLANTGGGALAATPNLLRTQHASFDAGYLPTPRWQLKGALSWLEQSNRNAAFEANDVTIRGAEVGINHLSPARNALGLYAAAEDGELPHRQLVGATLVDSSYRQWRGGAALGWTAEGSRLTARAGGVSRRHRELPARDFEHATLQTVHAWQATGALALSASVQRDVVPLDDVQARVVLAEGIALRAAWRLTEKTTFSGDLARTDLEYLGDAQVALGVQPPRNDRLRKVALGIAYRPARGVLLQLGAYREARSSSAAFGDYVAHVVSLSARLGF